MDLYLIRGKYCIVPLLTIRTLLTQFTEHIYGRNIDGKCLELFIVYILVQKLASG